MFKYLIVVKGLLFISLYANIALALPDCGPTATDYDGDGYGWEEPSAGGVGSCLMPTGDDGTDDCPTGDGNKNRITDVILTAGQSNAVARSTHYKNDESDLDRCSNNVFVWHNNKWTLANLNDQQWLSQMIVPQSHGGFQIAKQINSKDASKVIGIVPTGTNDRPISFWVSGNNQFTTNFDNVVTKTRNAVNNLSQVSKVSMIWWMQGENDDSNTNYGTDLGYLIAGFAAQNWFDSNQLFIANETRASYNTNAFIRALNSDADTHALTCSSTGQGYNAIGYVVYGNGSSNNDQTHFNSASYRLIGGNVADRFLGNTPCGTDTPSPTAECVDYLPHDGWGWNGYQSCQPIDRVSNW